MAFVQATALPLADEAGYRAGAAWQDVLGCRLRDGGMVPLYVCGAFESANFALRSAIDELINFASSPRLARMDEPLLSALRARVPMIRDRWEALLRVERVSSPLANPDTLIYLIPSSIDHVLAALVKPCRKPISLATARALPRPACNCGCNPYLAYFIAGEQALLEALVLTQSEMANLQNREADLAAFFTVVRRLATQEIEAFCAICTHRCSAKGCRFSTAGEGACKLARVS